MYKCQIYTNYIKRGTYSISTSFEILECLTRMSNLIFKYLERFSSL